MLSLHFISLSSSPTPFPSVTQLQSHLHTSLFHKCSKQCLPHGLYTELFRLPGRLFSIYLHGFLTSFRSLFKCHLIREVFLTTLSEITPSHFLFPYPALFFSIRLAPNTIYLFIISHRECKLCEGGDFCLFCSQLYPQGLKQCLVHRLDKWLLKE